MSTLRILLVDDEPLALDRLAALLRQCPGVEVVGTAGDGHEAAQAIAALRPDLVLLDIQMPEKSGLAVAADLPAAQRPEIVFVTAFEQFAPDAFEVEAADYLLKPVRFDRLRQAVERARRRRALQEAAAAAKPAAAPAAGADYDDAIWVQVRDGSLRVPVARIDWIEAARDYVMLHTETRSHIHRATMGALQRRLDPDQLLRVHRSAFVRLSLVTTVRRHANGSITLTVRDGASVQVGPSYLDAVAERLKHAKL
ncbi:MAG: DNA-binding response regulator [Lysobacterales bacterium 69-70]|nr:response regulator transcription factor [Xanthomonadaceae bacterium]ODU35409.1 MAG: DNA-binding response regulator [Xanthomonadaceae bacterium SCN 69-320]ODV16828.1 MAG: DNA-binding response regulator [Xanthomonadaceae bacterium SCN 69-25]OJY94302.1 MAG: DNA-binding response regulator [Xanthomonadales bacterium 69-70]